MKNEYNMKKRITITVLSVTAVCLAGGLFWYMGTLGNTQPPAVQTESQPEPTVTVPEIAPESMGEAGTVDGNYNRPGNFSCAGNSSRVEARIHQRGTHGDSRCKNKTISG